MASDARRTIRLGVTLWNPVGMDLVAMGACLHRRVEGQEVLRYLFGEAQGTMNSCSRKTFLSIAERSSRLETDGLCTTFHSRNVRNQKALPDCRVHPLRPHLARGNPPPARLFVAAALAVAPGSVGGLCRGRRARCES